MLLNPLSMTTIWGARARVPQQADLAEEREAIECSDAAAVDFIPRPDVVPCFTIGTQIATTRGAVAVEDLCPEDRIITRDNGIQSLAWIGARQMSEEEISRMPQLAQVVVRAGALGNGLPLKDLTLSPNHRVLVGGAQLTALTGVQSGEELLVSVGDLVGLPGIEQVAGAVVYYHFMFEQHQVVLSNGAWSESFQPGAATLGSLEEAQRREILALFPELRLWGGLRDYRAARPSFEQGELAARMAEITAARD